MRINIADSPTIPTHPLTQSAPHGALWRRGTMRRFEPVPARHAELVVLLGLSGQARYVIDGDVLALGRGGMIWALSGQEHMLLSQSNGFDMWVVLAHPKLWPHPPSLPLSRADRDAIGLRQLPNGAVEELDAIATGITPDQAAIGDGLRWWLQRAWAHAEAVPPSHRLRALHPAVARAARCIKDNPSHGIDQIIARAGLSNSRLRQQFLRETGRTLSQFRRIVRLELVDTKVAAGQDLTSAALDAGYGSYTQFFRDFVATRNSSPRDWYRQERRADQTDTGPAQ